MKTVTARNILKRDASFFVYCNFSCSAYPDSCITFNKKDDVAYKKRYGNLCADGKSLETASAEDS